MARRQIRVGQHAATDYRVEEALAEAEDFLATARAEIASALEAARADKEAIGEAEQERQVWLPIHRAG